MVSGRRHGAGGSDAAGFCHGQRQRREAVGRLGIPKVVACAETLAGDRQESGGWTATAKRRRRREQLARAHIFLMEIINRSRVYGRSEMLGQRSTWRYDVRPMGPDSDMQEPIRLGRLAPDGEPEALTEEALIDSSACSSTGREVCEDVCDDGYRDDSGDFCADACNILGKPDIPGPTYSAGRDFCGDVCEDRRRDDSGDVRADACSIVGKPDIFGSRPFIYSAGGDFSGDVCKDGHRDESEDVRADVGSMGGKPDIYSQICRDVRGMHVADEPPAICMAEYHIAAITDFLQARDLRDMGAVSRWHYWAGLACLLREGMQLQGSNSDQDSDNQLDSSEDADSEDDDQNEVGRYRWPGMP
mmetsp:Transcript_52318/g.168521  ORF Transcript_52318/g.168521 Transcript_52318/m.168521 type:complete len:359 (-) Transcript_52318:343-1419(-)